MTAVASNIAAVATPPATAINWSGDATHFVVLQGIAPPPPSIVLASREFLDFTDPDNPVPITIPAPSQIGQSIEFPAGMLLFTLDPGMMMDFTDAGALAVLGTFFSSVGISIRLHTGDPGSNYDQNIMTGSGYADIEVPQNSFAIATV